jgi:hypothetical protein
LAAELQAAPWTPLYKPRHLPIYDGLLDPKQFLIRYKAIISSYSGNAAVMAKSFIMTVKNVADMVLYSLNRVYFIMVEAQSSFSPIFKVSKRSP